MPVLSAPPVHHETARIASLRDLQVLDTRTEAVYDDIVRLASQICGTPIGLVSLIDETRQWFKARVGLAAEETHRDHAFCAHAIKVPDDVFIVADATRDPRFSGNPLVTGNPNIRFYAGAPIVMPDGHAMGTVCVIDTEPRELSAAQIAALQALSRQTTALFELRARTMASERQALALERQAAEAAEERRRSAELLDLVLRGGDLGLWDLDVATATFTANEREYQMLGYADPAAQPRGADWRALVHPEDWAVLNQALARHLSGEATYYSCEHRMRHCDGSWVWVLASAVAVERDAAGAPRRIVGTHMDITARIRDRHALEHASGLLRRMGAISKVGGWELELSSRQLTWTEEVYRIHELDPSTPPDALRSIEFYAPEARPRLKLAIDNAVANGTPWDLELPFITAKGKRLTVRAQGEAVWADGKVVRLTGAFQDVTEIKAAEQALSESQRHLRLITDNLPALVTHIDHEERYLYLNRHIQYRYGIDIQACLGRTMREVRGDELYATLAPHVAKALAGERVSFTYSQVIGGKTVHQQSNYIPDVDSQGRVLGFFSMTFDVTALHETQRELEQLARVDTLTGLPNRRQFDERIAEAMLRSRRAQQPMVLMFLDIDHFKTINDTHGHATGDAVLSEFARRLKACVRATDTVARLAGDEFVVLLEGVDDVGEAVRLAHKIVACIRPAFIAEGRSLKVTTSVGVTTYAGADDSTAALTPADVLARADTALYDAKKTGRNKFSISEMSSMPAPHAG